MPTGVIRWSPSAPANATADSAVNWLEGMPPSAVNDSARAQMASVAKWRDDNNGSLLTAGSSTAYTLTTNQGFAPFLVAGYTVCFTPHTTCGTTVLINIDSLGFKPLRKAPAQELAIGELIIGTPYKATYYGSSGGEWIVQSAAKPLLANVATTGNYYDLANLIGNASLGGFSSFFWPIAAQFTPGYGIEWTGASGYALAIGQAGDGNFRVLMNGNGVLNGTDGGAPAKYVLNVGYDAAEVPGTFSAHGIITRPGRSGVDGGHTFDVNWNGTNAEVYIDTTNVGLIGAPTTSIYPVGWYGVLKNSSAGAIGTGSTAPGGALIGVTFPAGVITGGGAAQAGTWMNISGGTLNNGDYGIWSRTA